MQNPGRRAVLKGAIGMASLAGLSVPTKAGGNGVAMRKIEIMGHRGAPALRPEHTLASYAKAIADGADFIEPDLQSTKDGVLVALHEPQLSHVSDVAEHAEFASRRRVVKSSYGAMNDWFLADFTFAEVKTLRLKERMPKIRPQNTIWDGEFQFLRFEEVIDFVAAESATRGRLIGLVPELKFPALLAKAGLPTVDHFLDILPRHSYLKRAPLVIQCFEASALQHIHGKIGGRANTRLMQLVGGLSEVPMDVALSGGHASYGDMVSPNGLSAVAKYADIVAPDIRTLIPLQKDGRLGVPHRMIKDAHKAGLQVGCYEFAPENRFLAADFRDARGENARNVPGSIAEIHHYLRAGIDSFFTDDPGTGRRALELYPL